MIRSLHISILLTGCYFFILFFDSLLWIADLPIFAALPSAIIVTTILYYYLFRPEKKRLLIHGLILVGSILISAGVASIIFDVSHDGQTYHYEAQSALLRRWNPLSGPLTSGTSSIFFINHYPKGFESGAANFWAFFGHPESGKALNILMLIATFFYLDHFLASIPMISKKIRRWIVAALIVLNPVTVCQLFTYYVDGQVALLLTMVVVALYSVTRHPGWNIHYLFAGLSFCLLADLKFTGLIYACLLFALFGIWIVIKRLKFIPLMVTGISALLITMFIGFNPYITNTVERANLFYPLMGKDKIDIMTPIQPLSFAVKNRVTKFLEANLSGSHNIGNNQTTPEPRIKIPFSFSIKEWMAFKGHESRMGGFGPLFSGVIFISIIIIITFLVKRRKQPVDPLILALILLITIFINPEMWFSRYVPQLWLLPFCIMWAANGINPTIRRAIIPVTMFIIALNALGIAMVNWGAAALISHKMHKELQWLKDNQPVKISTGTFVAAKERLNHYQIQMIPDKDTSKKNTYRLQNSGAFVRLKKDQQPFINTGILKLLDQK